MTDIVERLRRGIYCVERGRYDDDAMCDEAADRIEQLEAALREVSLQHYTDQRTVTPEIAHQAYRPLIAHVNAICDKARAALEDRT